MSLGERVPNMGSGKAAFLWQPCLALMELCWQQCQLWNQSLGFKGYRSAISPQHQNPSN